MEINLNKIKVRLDSFSSKYEDFLLVGDFNSEPMEETMSDFMELYDLKKFVRVPIYYKIMRNPLVLTFFLLTKTFASRALTLLKQDSLIS